MTDTGTTHHPPSLVLRGMRSYFAGGENRRIDLDASQPVALAMGSQSRQLDQSGDYQTGQIYVQEFLVENRNGAPPLLMWHGGGMTGVTWETTPDGRTGWWEHALRDGFDIHVSDAVERGRSSAPPDAVTGMTPVFRPKELSWQIFRIGPDGGYASDPAARQPFEGQRFPMHAYDELAKQFVVRWPALAPLVQEAYSAYLATFDRAILMAHSQGCGFAQNAAIANPDKLAAVVLVEPSGAPSDAGPAALAALRNVPHLVVWGDFFDQSPVWQDYRKTVEAQLDRLRDAGVPVTVIDLPAMGIRGNSHCPMMDDNSDAVWRLVSDWLLETAVRR